MIPIIETERLRLRGPRIADTAAYAAILGGPRSTYIGGPMDESQAWDDFCRSQVWWGLAGFGYWAVETRATRNVVAFAGISHDLGDPERELGWVVVEGHEGNGYATEAARAARDYALHSLGWSTLVSYIHPENPRSAAVATRLGATLDGNAERPRFFPECEVWRHRPETAS